MAKAVFTTKIEPTYDDLPEQRYHFPKTYLGAAEQAIDDWIVYYEPWRASGEESSRGGRQSYFAVARVTSIERDATHADHFYALVADYLEFDRAVPFKEGNHFYESKLQKTDGSTSKGAFGRSIRIVPEEEFDLIVQAGYVPTADQNEKNPALGARLGFEEDQFPLERPIVEKMVARPFRDAAFARHVKAAYEDTCSITGLKIVNGGGRAEVQAAHIRPVAERGPDSVRNGLALSGTIHWMFDRGLISIDDNYDILMARDRIPNSIGRMINPNGRLRLPPLNEQRPHKQFLEFHRNEVFKG